ncbi:MAG: hypothetical protein AABX88_00580 [Nanoarchaeota archaeon]
MKNKCCRLGEERISGKNVLYETDNFFIVPTIGQMEIEGYLLLCSKEHFVGTGNLPMEYDDELINILDKTKETISKVYNSEVLVFEHGPRLNCYKGGGCLDHMHFHLVPTDVNLKNFLKPLFNLEEIKNFSRLREIYQNKKSSYLFFENQDKEKYLIEVDIPLPSQYLRQVISTSRGKKDWDWRIYPDDETFDKTLKRLKGEFK